MDSVRMRINLISIKTLACLFARLAIWQLQARCTRKERTGTNQSMVYFFDVDKCKLCSRREGCYKEGAKSKTYSVQIKSSEHQQHEAFEKSEEFRSKAKVRYKIEAKNSPN